MASTTQTTTQKKGGRKKGTTNWKEAEKDALLEAIEIELPCGKKQWEIVAGEMFLVKYHRFAESCRKKFEKLYETEKPTGSTEICRHVLKAQQLKEKIEVEEAMGRVNKNDSDHDSDEESPLKGTNLFNEDGEMKRPLTKKRKTQQVAEAIKELSDSQKEAAETVANAMRDMAASMSTEVDNGVKERMRTM